MSKLPSLKLRTTIQKHKFLNVITAIELSQINIENIAVANIMPVIRNPQKEGGGVANAF